MPTAAGTPTGRFFLRPRILALLTNVGKVLRFVISTFNFVERNTVSNRFSGCPRDSKPFGTANQFACFLLFNFSLNEKLIVAHRLQNRIPTMDAPKKLRRWTVKRAWLLYVLVIFSALLFLSNGMARAQEATGKIVGTVFDQQAAVIPGAQVTVTNTATGVTSTGVTNKEGYFEVPNLERPRFSGAFLVLRRLRNTDAQDGCGDGPNRIDSKFHFMEGNTVLSRFHCLHASRRH